MNCAKLLGQKTIPLAKLLVKYPPEYHNPYKKRVADLALSKWENEKWIRINPDVKVGCYECKPLAKINLSKMSDIKISAVSGFYKYGEHDDDEVRYWYVNFADSSLFGFYETDMFAQDEIQTLEHPVLASIREWLDKKNYTNIESRTVRTTVNESGEKKIIPTPILCENIPYWISVNTNPKTKDGRSQSIYGNHFNDAVLSNDFELLDAGIKVRDGDSCNNILAMAAPSGGKGEYTKKQIVQFLETAISGFGACVHENETSSGRWRSTVIHSGKWGCGAFGGNEELSVLVQMISAMIAGAEKLILHEVSQDAFKKAGEVAKEICDFVRRGKLVTAENLADFILSQEYRWGVGDGN